MFDKEAVLGYDIYMKEQPTKLIGKSFTKLVIMAYEGTGKYRNRLYKCRCDCGNEKVIGYQHLKSGSTKSCGCLRKFHRLSNTQFYSVWRAMRSRCGSKRKRDIELYLNRGITVCERWNKFENFMDDMYKEYLIHVETHGEKYTTLERQDNDAGYSLENCTWATPKEQARNRRSNVWLEHDGRKMIMEDWAIELGITPQGLSYRLDSGWSVERALTKEIDKERWSKARWAKEVK